MGHGPSKVSVIGAGHVGSAVANALVLLRVCDLVMLHDRDLAKAEGEAWDIADTIPLLSAMEILPAANYTDLGDSDVVVVTVGATVTPGQSRLDVLGANASVISGIMGQLDETCPGAVVILVSNPVDVLARIAIEASPRPPGRVLGCWTVLDGARLRHQLGTLLNLERESIHAYVIGEHGDSSFPSGQALPPGRSGSRNTSSRGRLMATDQGGADRLDPGPRGEHPPAQGLHQLRCGGGSRPYRPCCHPGREAHLSWSPLWRQRSTASGPWRSACPCVVGAERQLLLPMSAEEQQSLQRSAAILDRAYQSLNPGGPAAGPA